MSVVPAPDVWSPAVIRPSAGDAVLVVDFTRLAAGRDAVDVVAEAFPERTILRFDPVVPLSGGSDSLSLDQLSSLAMAGLDQAGCVPELIIGYCSGAPLAMRLAQQLGPDAEVPLALLAPGFPQWEHIEADLDEVLATVGSPACPEPMPRHGSAAREFVATTIDAALHRAVAEMGMGPGEADVLIGELGARYKAWLNYLICATEAEHRSFTGDLAVLHMPEPWAAPPSGWPAQAHLVDTMLSRAALLDSEHAVETVRLLADVSA